jgi:phosphatidylethanolamine/phosphatidyl-N-methylethanolamine N-methyltransferase
MSNLSIVQNPEMASVDHTATALTRARYQRISRFYDRIEAMMGQRVRGWRRKQWQLVNGARVLEVGVGTGKNMEFWPAGKKITAVDLTPGMLEIARQRLEELERDDDLRLGDVQSLAFASGTFDTVVATFVFCSVPDPVLGLREVARVVRPGGQVLLLEHVRIDRPVVGALMDILAPLVVRLEGSNINRRTVKNVQAAGLHIERVENLDGMGMFKLIVARPSA